MDFGFKSTSKTWILKTWIWINFNQKLNTGLNYTLFQLLEWKESLDFWLVMNSLKRLIMKQRHIKIGLNMIDGLKMVKQSILQSLMPWKEAGHTFHFFLLFLKYKQTQFLSILFYALIFLTLAQSLSLSLSLCVCMCVCVCVWIRVCVYERKGVSFCVHQKTNKLNPPSPPPSTFTRYWVMFDVHFIWEKGFLFFLFMFRVASPVLFTMHCGKIIEL